MVSPLLSCIYLDKLDKYVERELVPQYTRGSRRKRGREYSRLAARRWNARQRGDRDQARDLAKQMRAIPSADPMDPGYRRLFYIRYADDHLLGFAGPKAEAEQIKAALAAFLRETLALELNASKTPITHARTRAARFLGYQITVQHSSTKLTNGQRSANGRIALRVPPDVITAQCARYRRRGKPWHRSALQNLPDYDIVRIYGAQYRGVVNYYRPACDVWRLSKLRWNAETSMLKTLAAKHKSTVTKTAARYKAKVITSDGPRTCFEARVHREGQPDLVARFGGIPLTHDGRAVINDPALVPVTIPRKELIHRLRRKWCELCEHGATVAVHHVASTRRPRKIRARPARVGSPHGKKAAQNAHRLRLLPRAHPRKPRREHGIVTGEPSAPKGARWVRRKAARKRPAPTPGTGPRRAAHPVYGLLSDSGLRTAPGGFYGGTCEHTQRHLAALGQGPGSGQMHRLSRLHHRVQERERGAGGASRGPTSSRSR